MPKQYKRRAGLPADIRGFCTDMTKNNIIKSAAKIADQRANAEKKARDLIVERAKAEQDIARLREKAVSKDKFTAEERIKFLEEAGTMNIFFRIGNQLITAPTNDRILDGVTRKSLIALAEKSGIDIQVRPFSVDELLESANSGTLLEIFGSGTAVVVNPIKGFGYKDYRYDVPDIEDSFALKLKEQLIAIQYNLAEDPFQWRFPV